MKPQTRLKNNPPSNVNWKSSRAPLPVNWGMQAQIPVWQESTPHQNHWCKSSATPYQFGASNYLPRNILSRNEFAPRWTPLPMGGSPVWGNNQFVQIVRQALGIIHQIPYM